MYCGDETGAFIGDIGGDTCRFGYGGEDNPKHVIPSYVWSDGVIASPFSSRDGSNRATATAAAAAAAAAASELQFHSIYHVHPKSFGYSSSNSTSNPIEANPNPNYFLANGHVIENWNAYEAAWQNAFHVLNVRDSFKHTTGSAGAKKQQGNNEPLDHVNVNVEHNVDGPITHPILAVDSGFTHAYHSDDGDDATMTGTTNTTTTTTTGGGSSSSSDFQSALQRKQRCQMTELFMESMETHSLFVAPSPMLAAFSYARQTALVVDLGAHGCRVTPVVDGLLLANAQRRNGRGGAYLNRLQEHVLCTSSRSSSSSSRSSHTPSSSSPFSYTPRFALPNKNHTKTMDSSSLSSSSSLFYKWAVQCEMYEMRTAGHVPLSPHRIDWTTPFLYPKQSNNNNNNNDDNSGGDTMAAAAASAKSSPEDSSNNNNNNNNNNNDNDNNGAVPVPMDIDHDNDDHKNNHDEPTLLLLDRTNTTTTQSSSGSSSTAGSTNNGNYYQLPDGTRVDLERTPMGRDLCRLPELLFTDQVPFVCNNKNKNNNNNDDDNNVNAMGVNNATTTTLSNLPLHKLIHSSLSAVGDAFRRKELASNIILVGGGAAAFSGNVELPSRLSYELMQIISSSYKPKVLASKFSEERAFAPWIGGSILTSLGSFQQLWLTRQEYQEYGPHLSINRFP